MNYEDILDQLEQGTVRAANKTENGWEANV